MSDLIRREDVVSRISDLLMIELQGKRLPTWNEVYNAINDISSIEPERKKGRWQCRNGSDCWECSQCHAVLEDFDIKLHNYYFCYHCGANMMTMDGWMNIEEVKHE